MKHILFSKKVLVWLVLFVSIHTTGFSQIWAWKSGTNTINNLGTFGTQGVGSVLNTPGSLQGSFSWTDATGNLWLFGGEGFASAGSAGKTNDLWKYNTASNQWTWMSGSSTINNFGIYGTLGVASSSNIPGARAYGTSWIDNSGNLWLFGGEGYDAAGSLGYLNDLWKYNVATNQWTWISGNNLINQYGLYGTQSVGSSSNTPGARVHVNSWKDASGDLWLFGGYGLGASTGISFLNDVWKYSIGTNQWTWMNGYNNVDQTAIFGTQAVGSSTNTPGARYGYTAWKDNSGNFWLTNGYGFDGANVGYLSDVWKYNPSNNQWSWMSGSSTINQAIVYGTKGFPSPGNTPGGRHICSSWTDNSGNLFLFGGATLVGMSNDLWKYNIGTGVWTCFRVGTNYGIYGIKGTASVDNNIGYGQFRTSWKDNSGNFWLFGGGGNDMNNQGGYLNELWQATMPTLAPVSNFNFNQTAQVCIGSKIIVTDASTNTPIAWSYSLDGTAWNNNSQNPFLQFLPNYTISPGTHTVTQICANIVGSSSPISKTISVSSSTMPSVYIIPAGTTTVNIGSGSTNNSDWSPWNYYFGDPIPPNAKIVKVTLTFDAVDQGWGGTGATLSCYLSGNPIGGAVLLHNWQSFTLTSSGPFPGYTTGANNYFSMYFVGWGGWQSFISNAQMVIEYEPASKTVCAGGTVTLNATGAPTLNWSGGALNGVAHTPTASAIYTVTGIAPNSCVSSSTISIIVNPLPIITFSNSSLCSGNSFTINPIGANTYTYSSGSSIVSPTTNTSYSVTGTSLEGCLSAAPAVINLTVNPLPTLSVSGNTYACIGSPVSQTVTGATTYSWSTGATTNIVSLSPTVNTTYIVTGTNSATGCTNTLSKSISISPIPTITVNGGTVCSGNSFTINALGANSYTYSGGSNVVYPLTNTNYSVIGSDALGCVSSSVISAIVVNPSPTVTVNSGAICAGSSFSITPVGANTFSFLTGNTLVTPTVNSSYSIIGFSSLGCLSTNTAVSNVTVNPLPVLSISGNSVVCSGSSISQTVSGASTYTWSTGAITQAVSFTPSATTVYTASGTNTLTGCVNSVSRMITVANLPIIGVNSGNMCAGQVFTMIPSGASTYTFSNGSNTVSPLSNSSYFVSGTSSLGCVSTASAISNVIVNPAPVIVLNSGAICTGGSFTITPNGASTYTFLNGAAVVSPGTTTTYSVTGTSVLGCLSAAPGLATVTVNQLPSISVNSGTVCSGGIFTLVPTGALSYTYTGGSNLVSPLSNTSYSVTGTSSAGCVSSSPGVSNVTVVALPIISVNSGTVCLGSPFTLAPSNAVTYTFSNGSPTVIPTSNSSYSVFGTNAQGCISSIPAIANVTTVALPIVTVNSGIVCAGQVFTLNPSGAVSYSYSSGSSTVSPLTNSSYVVTGTSSVGCVSSPAISNVTVNAMPTLSIIATASICSGASVNLLVFGATNYTWSTNATGSVITVNPSQSTTYSVTALSVNGCAGAAAKLISIIPLPTITVNSGAVCPGVPFVLNPSGASTYTFSSGTNTVLPLVTTNYTVTGTDANGCESLLPAIATVSIVNTVSINISGTNSICIGQTASLTANGATTYTWNNGLTNSNINVSPQISTSYTVIGESGTCSDTAEVIVVVNNLPTISATSSSSLLCAGESATLSSTGATTFTWNTSAVASSLVVNPTTTSSYTVTGTDANGCSNSVVYAQHVSKCTGIAASRKLDESLFSVYPNPNAGEFYVESSTKIEMDVFNALGQLVLKKTVDEGINKINLQDVSKGIYFIQFNQNNQTRTIKIIKE